MKVLLGIGGSEDSFRALERTVERAAEAVLRDSPVEATLLTLEGHAGSRLVELAEQEGFDRLALGGGETSPLGKVTLGEIAEFVILNANTSVTLIR